MRAAIVTAPRSAVVREVNDLHPTRDGAVVRVIACGVCGSDQNAWRGVEGIAYPLEAGAPGHELYGEVAELPAGHTSTLRTGDRVVGVASNAYAERALVPLAHLLRVPDALDGRIVLGEPLACAMNAARRAGEPEGTVAFVGFGYLAALIAQVVARGREWVCVTRRPESRALALRLGARAAYDYGDIPSDLWESFPLVVEAAGAQTALDHATWLVRTRGRLVIAGYHADGPRTVDVRTWNWKGIDVINAHERAPEAYLEGMREALDRMVRGELDDRALITHEWPLERIADALAAAERRDGGLIKGVVLP